MDGCERLRTVANGCKRLRTVADGCERLGNVERTHPQPPDPQSETGTLATHSGKTPPKWKPESASCVHKMFKAMQHDDDDEEEEEDNHDHLEAGKFPMMIL